MQPVGDRLREVCSVCGTIFYQNPLPAAAAVVLDDARRVLLVKRRFPPGEGMWCLPMGFAEMGETIAEAAMRELREETAVVGRVTRLIDADSWQSEFYGDVLVVFFEAEKVSGTETAGDDAEDVRYFAIDRLPPLAFPSNEKAIRLCGELHRDEWAIQDSFNRLEEGNGEEMLSDTLVGFVSEHAPFVARLWLADVRSSHSTIRYLRLDPDVLLEECTTGLQLLGRWLEGESTEDEIKAFYRDLGAKRRGQGLESYEMLSALLLLKKHIWTYARSQGVWERPVDAYRMMELQSRFAVYFDKSAYYLMRGYAEGGTQPCA
jgi:ADP-ribose pyrophosphatase YjhB (NUDIX family)